MPTQATGITTKQPRQADQYNDPAYNYMRYWDGRDYENACEYAAIGRLLKNKHFKRAIDIGGGYGRLVVLLERYADKVILAEPSQKQLDLAEDYLKDHPEVERKLTAADDLHMPDESVDLVTMIRVMHHLPDPSAELAEISRILKDDGFAIIEIANYTHVLNRLKFALKWQRLPLKPVDIRSPENRKKSEIPFVNHNPDTVIRQLEHAGLRVERTLSVSNLRNTWLKRHLPIGVMVTIEKLLQVPMAPFYFGPSIFFLVRKAD